MDTTEAVKDNYAEIVQQNLKKLFSSLSADFAQNLPANQMDQTFEFKAFGRQCTISSKQITLSGLKETSDRSEAAPEEPGRDISIKEQKGDQNLYDSLIGILVSLYALHANPDTCLKEPFRGFKEFPGTMPYIGAFTTHTEHLLIPAVSEIKKKIRDIKTVLGGEDAPTGTAGDFAFVVYPLPKIALCYIFYEKDEDFDASVTCLFSNNADKFISTAGLADVGEYTSRTILEIIDQE